MMLLVKHQALRFFKHPDWNLPHGFFTRAGGKSEGIYRGLNCGTGSEDEVEKVRQNQQFALQALQFQKRAHLPSNILLARLHILYQHHSADVINVPFAADAVRQKDGYGNHRIKGDAMIACRDDFTNDSKGDDSISVMLAIMTADCAPVLFYDLQAGVIGASHAGWKGALFGILENTIKAMEAKGGMRKNIMAAIGPAIQANSYQVGAEFRAQFLDNDPSAAQFFTASDRAGKYQFNLPDFVHSRLLAAGLDENHIAVSDADTYREEDLFFSYRRSCHKSEADYGRNFSLIGF